MDDGAGCRCRTPEHHEPGAPNGGWGSAAQDEGSVFGKAKASSYPAQWGAGCGVSKG